MTKNTSLRKALALFAMVVMSASAHMVAAAEVQAQAPAVPVADALLARGAYLAKAADCAACHTAPDGKPMAGGLPIGSPFGEIYASNITPSKAAGIGGYSEAQFARAVRNGIRPDGTHLYPAMPYPSYAGLSDADVSALYGWFTQGVESVDVAAPETQLQFPFNQRWLMAGWNLLFASSTPNVPVEGRSAEWNRGRYLVETLGHCDSCHTPRNIAMGEKTGLWLAGGQVDTWRAPNITSDPVSGIGGWTHAELAQYLRTGAVAGKAHAAGPMAEVIDKSLQYLSDDDIAAIATYLKESKPVRNPNDTRPAYSYDGSRQDYEAALRGGNPGIGFEGSEPGYVKLTTGAQLFSANCASCHQSSGAGTRDNAFPALTNNSALGRDNADNLVMVILDGVHIATQGTERQMPGFADDLTDQQVAELATFVMKQHGTPEVAVTGERVSQLRGGGGNAFPMSVIPVIGGLVLLLVVFVIVWVCSRRKRARAEAA
jgi:mono/diheme cytochrome c family protein